LSGQLDRAEVAAEIERQLERFEEEVGFPPDFVDGHHHVHIFPGIRRVVLDVVAKRFPRGGILLRDPSDHPATIVRRGGATGKALGVGLLASGFGDAACARGFSVNAGFSGYSSFGRVSFAREFDVFLQFPGPRHMIMCHPGFEDSELRRRDPIASARPQEYQVLSTRGDVPNLIWRAKRPRDRTNVRW
jgi:predicted glycoside hydrolase/deacetylase ChbG (UPF0249 family)